VAFEASDQKVLAAAARTASGDERGATSSPTDSHGAKSTQDSSQESSQESGDVKDDKGKTSLSTGEIVGIAVGALCAGILITCPLLFLLLRFCLGYRRIPKDEKAAARVASQTFYDGIQDVQYQLSPPTTTELTQPTSERRPILKELATSRSRAELHGNVNFRDTW
jgi:tetrahydromethanopterin S-methyltransferase subunit F